MGTRGGISRGSTLIYHLKTVRSRTHFPTAPLPGLPANGPDSLMVCAAILFPFNAIWNSYVFYHFGCIFVKDSLIYNLSVFLPPVFKP